MVSLLGSQEGLAHIALSIVDEGDTVLVPREGIRDDARHAAVGVFKGISHVSVEKISHIGQVLGKQRLIQSVISHHLFLYLRL